MASHSTISDDETGFFDAINVLLRRKWFILLVTTAITAAAVGFAFYQQPVYRVETVLFASNPESMSKMSSLTDRLGGLTSLAGIDIGSGGSAQALSLATLKSRGFASDLIVDNGLMPIFYAKQWDAENQKWIVDEDNPPPTLWDSVDMFVNTIRFVTEDKTTGLVSLAIEWRDPEVARDWVLKIVQSINEKMRTQTIQESEQILAYLADKIERTSTSDVRQALYSLIESHTKSITFAEIRKEFAFKVIDPPVAPDLDNFVRPRRKLIIALGLIGGLLIGVFLSLILEERKRQSAKQRIKTAS
ncbi:MAG: hypothetical protein HQL54_05685 [Magnetococcales bacterium]|nr:hypothetical protein [Magnetococcales bacterium]